MPESSGDDLGTTYTEGDIRLKTAVSLLLAAVATMATKDADLASSLAALRLEVSRLTGTHTDTAGDASLETRDEAQKYTKGSGAASPEIYQRMIQNNWHGRLGRTHMADVDKLPDSAKMHLDSFLRAKIGALHPLNKAHTVPIPDNLFAALSAFGLRLEDRGALADVSIFNDNANTGYPTVTRLQNFTAWYYAGGGGDFSNYWRGSALETLLALGQYRGLFDEKGFLKPAK